MLTQSHDSASRHRPRPHIPLATASLHRIAPEVEPLHLDANECTISLATGCRPKACTQQFPYHRITPDAGLPVEAGSPALAWLRLFDSNPAQQLKATQTSGPKIFGLLHPAVARLTQQLPNAERCEHYCNWPGKAPPVPPLVSLRCCSMRIAHAVKCCCFPAV